MNDTENIVLFHELVDDFYKLKNDLSREDCKQFIFAIAKQACDQTRTAERQDAQLQLDKVYAERNMCVALICRMAAKLGHEIAIMRDKTDNEWFIVFITLGENQQVSWHVHQNQLAWFNCDNIRIQFDEYWDGHDNDTKYQRVLNYR